MKRFNQIMLFVNSVALVWVLFNSGLLLHIRSLIEAGRAEAVIPEWMGYAVALFILTSLLFHLLGLACLVKLLGYFKDDSMLRSASFVIGFFSMFLLVVDVVMLNDIGHEYLAGFDVSGEWRIVFFNHAIHTLFTLLLLVQCLAAGRRMQQSEVAPEAVKDEALYLTVHQTGICAALVGLLLVLAVFWTGVAQTYINGLLFMFSVVGLFPYGLAVLYWLVTKRRERPVDWYDEKQLADLSYGALVALVASVALMMVIYTLHSLHVWENVVGTGFPIYFFLTLLVFSGGTLYFSKRA